MLELYGVTEDLNEVELGYILSLTINREENVPADDLSVTLAYNNDLPEIYRVRLTDDGETVFRGIVDEQFTTADRNGAYNKIVARSMAALLLDNESIPVNYNQPSASDIFKYHIEPFGFKEYKGANKVAEGILTIPKGSTNWYVVEAFTKKAFGGFPRVESDGTINFAGVKNESTVKFSINDGVDYNSIKENKKKYKLLSNVRVKLKPDCGYDLNVKNKNINGGVIRERLIDATISAVTPYTAQTMLDNGDNAAYEIEITSPRRLLNILGSKALVDDEYIGTVDNLYVSSLYYKLTPDAEYTTVTLKRNA